MSTGAMHAAAMWQAIKASGAIVRVEPGTLMRILGKEPEPLIVTARGGFLAHHAYQYLTPYKGLIFYTESPTQLTLPGMAQVIEAQQIWVPS